MRIFFLSIVIVLLFSCNKKTIADELCISKLTLRENTDELLPPVLKIDIMDKENILSKKVSSYLLTDVVFYSTKRENNVSSYIKLGDYKRNGDTTSIFVSNPFLMDKKFKKEIVLKDGIGLVIDKDTLLVKGCVK